MRIAMVDIRSTDGFVSKDTIVGGYGSRLRPFTATTEVIAWFKQRLHAVPSVQMAYLAAICARAGHDVCWTDGAHVDADVAIVLSSLVDYRHEVAWVERQRKRGTRVGVVGLAASKLPALFARAADFVVHGEPESAVMRLAAGAQLSGLVESEPLNLDVLPFPRWDLIDADGGFSMRIPLAGRQRGRAYSVLASRGCPEFCTYCPHRILAGHRERSVANVVDEVQALAEQYEKPYVIFRDPLFTKDRERCLALCDEIVSRGLRLRFECETRLDRLDDELLEALMLAGLRAVSFGVETLSPETLRRSGRRVIPDYHQRHIVEACRKRGVVTAGFYVLGFLQDTWDSILATIDYAIDLGSTVAQFKILTPYPGTPMWTQLEPLVFEKDWERFDGYTPTFQHPNLSGPQLRYLLGAAYTRFYMRPSYLAGYLRLQPRVVRMARVLDAPLVARQVRKEQAFAARGGVVVTAPYLAVYFAAMIEGEAVFAVASVLVAAGKLHALGVIMCGALGAATGDQIYFYVFRGAFRRFAGGAAAAEGVPVGRLARVRAVVAEHQTLAAFALRFMPGFRIALAAACAWAHQSPLRFSVIDTISSFVWASALLALIAWVGPGAAHALGINARWVAAGIAVLIVVATWRIARLADGKATV